MGWIDLFNKTFPEPKPKKSHKRKNWKPDPQWFENSVKEKELNRVVRTLEKDRKSLLKSLYDVLDSERNADGSVNLPKKKLRENLIQRSISEIDQKLLALKSKPLNIDRYIERRSVHIEESEDYLREKRNIRAHNPEVETNNQTRSNQIKLEKSLKRFDKGDKEISIIKRLVELKFLSRNPEVRTKQWQTIEKWLRYINHVYSFDYTFRYLVLGTILKYDIYWLDKNPDGNWFSRERRNKNKDLDFPMFDNDIMPEVLAVLRDKINTISTEIGSQPIAEIDADSQIGKALLEGNIREMIWQIRENITLSRIDYSQVNETIDQKWLPSFSFKNKDGSDKTEIEKLEIAYQLAKEVSFSRGFCIKSPSTAYEYLSNGDVYVYNVRYKVDLNKGKKDKDGRDIATDIREVVVPEIAIHTLRAVSLDTNKKTGKVIINPKEIHGNAPNQGINKEYLEVARKWVSESDFANKDEFEVKFADAEMLAVIGDKIYNLINGGEDLNSRELKFLYQVYRKVEHFEIHRDGTSRELENLKEVRLDILMELKFKNGEYNSKDLSEQYNLDYSKMFDCKPEEVFLIDYKQPLKELPKNIKVLVGNIDEITLFFLDKKYLQKIEVIVGNVTSRLLEYFTGLREVTNFVYLRSSMTPSHISDKLQKIHGIEINLSDKDIILKSTFHNHNGEYPEWSFPGNTDPRIRKILY
jgi:hypothetical protein